MSSPLKFAPLAGSLDVNFFSELARRKLHEYKLSDHPVDVVGSYARAERANAASPLCLGADAFANNAATIPPSLCVAPGMLRNANTMEDFKEWDKAELLVAAGKQLADEIASGAALRQPEVLMRFILLTFADLKTHKFYYWFAFPAFSLEKPPTLLSPPAPLSTLISPAQVAQLVDGYAKLAAVHAAANDDASGQSRSPPVFAVRVPPSGSEHEIEVGPIAFYAAWRSEAASDGSGAATVLLAFCDPCPMANHPGWPLRNLLALAATLVHPPPPQGTCAGATAPSEAATVRVLCFREPPKGTSTTVMTSAGGSGGAASIVLTVGVPPPPAVLRPAAATTTVDVSDVATTTATAPERPPLPSVVGWEKNSNGKLGPRLMDLSAQMDPHALAESSVDLNLRLMRWRLMPSLQTENLAATKCLLFGAGTLGCAVARNLIGWGVRHITFIDSGTVSYSNPVRQTLFNFEDCLDGGKPKAQAAADALKTIFPSVQSYAHRLSIPMPGHAVGSNEQGDVESTCQQIDNLISSHDVTFLLTDTRESRWLPSLLAAHHRKLCINAALGFDSLMVMRHGLVGGPTPPSPPQEPDGVAAAAEVPVVNFGGATNHLGCYFCNDVVAPANSMLRRTLDQQCTVSRPGLSFIASALAVEMMVNVLHHPLGAAAEADLGGGMEAGAGGSSERSPLGSVPHQLRASLPMFRVDSMVGRAFDKCTACSNTVLGAYKEKGFEFLLTAFNRATYLEDLTGLTQMHAETEAALQDVGIFDDDDDEFEDD